MTNYNRAQRSRKVLLRSTALAALIIHPPSFAEDAITTLPEIVVTARHISENLKDTPVAVSAFSADQLLTQGAQTITDLTTLVPSTSLFVGRGSNSTLTAYIRGIGQQDPTWGSEPGVGLYVDDVYYARPQAAVLDIFNVSQIEILRGPQGTLYGRNVIGGAIKYVTKELTDQPTADARVSYGSYNEHDLLASFSAPVSDKIRVGAAIADYNHDGWGKALTSGAPIDNRDEVAGRVTLEFRPNAEIWFRLNADDTVDLSTANPGHKEVPFGGYAVLANDYNSYAGEQSRNYVTDRGLSLTGSWAVDPAVTLKSTTAYRQRRTNTNIDFDGLPQAYLDVPGRYNDHQTSEEVQAIYDLGGLRGVAGLFAMDSLAAGEFDEELRSLLPFPISDFLKGSVLTNSWAGYADGSFDLTDSWTLSAGGRYSHDAKSAIVYNAFFAGIPSPAFGAPSAAPFAVNTNISSHKGWGEFTPRISLSYKLTPDVTSYVSYTEGFRSGGFDIRGNAALYPQTVNGYNPETVDSFEVGVKGNYFGRRVSVDLDGYYASYHDQQVPIQSTTPKGVFSAVENAAASHIEGIELQAAATLTPALSLSINSDYCFATFDQFSGLPAVVSVPTVAGFQYAPKWSNGLTVSYDKSLPDASRLTATGTVAYRSFTHLYDTPSVIDQRGYSLIGGMISWTTASGRWSVSLKGSNLTDERYRIGGYNLPGPAFGNSVVGFYGAPRTLLSSVSAHF